MTTGHIRILAISIACVLCACFVDSASAQPQAAPTYYFCLSHPTPDTAYFSGVFVQDYSIDGDARAWNAAGERERRSGGGAPQPGPAPWVAQFDQFVAQTYPRTAKGASSCSNFRTLVEAQKRLDEVIQSEQNFKYKVFKTGWKYAPAAGAPSNVGAAAGQTSTAAASAPTAASGTATTQGKIYFCTNQVVLDQQNRKYKEYWSDAFGSDAKQADLSSAWLIYLATTYQLNPNDGRQINGGCGDETTVQLTREWKAGAKQRWERTTKIELDRVAAAGSPGIVEEHAVVDTGWKYTPNPNAAPSVPAASRPGDPCFFNPHGLATAPPAGCGPARVVSPTPPAAPVASAAANPPPTPRSLEVQNTAPAGTVVVRIIHPIDSSHDAVGTKYMVTVVPGNRSIPPGSTATVMLTKTAGGGLTLQLISISTAGRTVAVTGGSAAIAATTVRTPALLGRMSASGASVFVPTQTSLSFVLGATP